MAEHRHSPQCGVKRENTNTELHMICCPIQRDAYSYSTCSNGSYREIICFHRMPRASYWLSRSSLYHSSYCRNTLTKKSHLVAVTKKSQRDDTSCYCPRNYSSHGDADTVSAIVWERCRNQCWRRGQGTLDLELSIYCLCDRNLIELRT